MPTLARDGFNMAPAKTLSNEQLSEQITECIRLFGAECVDEESNSNMAIFYAGRLTALSAELVKRLNNQGRRLGDIHDTLDKR